MITISIMRKKTQLVLLSIIFLLCVGCTDKINNVDSEIEKGDDVSLYFSFNISNDIGTNMTKATNAEVFDEFYQKIVSSELVAASYELELTEINSGAKYNFIGSWNHHDMVTLRTGTYHVVGKSFASGVNIQNKCSFVFDETVEITTNTSTIILTASYDCFLLVFNSNEISKLFNFNGEDTISLFTFQTYKYAFVNDKLYKEDKQDKAYLGGFYSDGAEFRCFTGKLKFEKGKYYVYNSVTGGFIVPKMEEGAAEGVNVDSDIEYNSGVFNIYTGNGMKIFADIVNGINTQSVKGYDGIPNQLYSANGSLEKDIDLSNISNWPSMGSEEKPYSGVFNGNSHKISNLNLDYSTDKVGLWGYINEAQITGVDIVSGSLVGGGKIGSIAGYAVASKIYSCSNAIDINSNGGTRVGGIVGGAENTIIDKCYNIADVYCYSNGSIGGILGEGKEAVIIRNCYNTGKVTGGHYSIGGIAGMIFDSYLYNCYNLGDVSHTGATQYGNSVAGILGTLYRGACINCYNNGNVSGGTFENASGIVAFASDTDGYASYTNDEYTISYGYYLNGCCLRTIYSGTTSNVCSYYSNMELETSVIIGPNSYSTVLAALNAWVNNNNSELSYSMWKNGENGLPCFY